MALTTVTQTKQGWIPYGATDDDIVYRCPCTSAAAFVTPEIGGSVSTGVTGTGEQYDSIKGFNGGAAARRWVTTITNSADLDVAGQLIFEVEKEFITYLFATYGSTGYVPGAQAIAMGITATSGGNQTLLAKNTGGNLGGGINGGFLDATFKDRAYTNEVGVYINSGSIESDFVKVGLSWGGGKEGGLIWLAINDISVGYAVRNGASHSGLFASLFIGGSATAFMGDYYIRNIQISRRQAVVPVLPKIRKIGILSDSLWSVDNSTGDPARSAPASYVMRGYLESQGFRCGSVYFDVNGGYTLRTTGSNDLFDSTNLTALQAAKPTVVIIQGGTNDLLNDLTIDAAWYAELKTNVETILAYDSVTDVVIGLVPSIRGSITGNTAARQATRITINSYINQLQTDVSNVFAFDPNISGGETRATSPEYSFLGEIPANSGYETDIHYAALGHLKLGQAAAKAIINNVLK